MYVLGVNTYPDQKVESNADECTAKWMIHFSGTKLLQSLVHPPTPRNSGLWAWRTGEHTSSRILEIKGRPVLFDVNSLKNTAL